MSLFKKATRTQAKLRMALQGPSGSGKTYSALAIAMHLVPGGRVALIDTESGSASKYARNAAGKGFDFDTMSITESYTAERLFDGIAGAVDEGCDVLIIDSMTHFWNGPGGIRALVDEQAKRMSARSGKTDTFAAWKMGNEVYQSVVQRILGAPIHMIMTMRAKQEHVKEQDDRGKTIVRKIGMAPEMRDGFEYEADVEGMMDMDHNLVIGKTRCDEIDGKVFNKPGKALAEQLRAWLSDGVEAPAVQPKQDHVPAASDSSPGLDAKLQELEAAVDEAPSQDALTAVMHRILSELPEGPKRKRLGAAWHEKRKILAIAVAAQEEADAVASAAGDQSLVA
jgi:KaiC/GvpD/RAD55 family RecA-like ATPase